MKSKNLNQSLTFVLALLILSGCVKNETRELTAEEHAFVGTWQYIVEEKNESQLDVEYMQLIIHESGLVSYEYCFVQKFQSSQGAKRSSKSINLPDAVLIELTPTQLVLEQSLEFIHFEYELELNRSPYQEAGRWYMDVEQLKLQKLSATEVAALVDWVCPNNEE